MKKTTVLLLLMTVASAYAQNLKTSIDGSLLNQGAKGINAIKLRNTLHLMTDSLRVKPTKQTLGLGNVDNTSDINKPISSATSIALGLKAPITNPTFYGVLNVPSGGIVTNGFTTNTFRLLNDYDNDFILTSDSNGFGTWQLNKAVTDLTFGTDSFTWKENGSFNITPSLLRTDVASSIYAPLANPSFSGEIESRTIKMPGTEVFGENNLIKLTNTGPGAISNFSIDRYNGTGTFLSNVMTIRNNDVGFGTVTPAYGVDINSTFRVTGQTILPSNTTIGTISNIELSYIDGLTSPAQTQINTKLSSSVAATTYAALGTNNTFLGVNIATGFSSNSLNPYYTLKQTTTNNEWRMRGNFGNGVASTAWNLYNQTTGKYAITAHDDGNVMIGSNAYYAETRLGVFGGGGSHGANIDVRGTTGAFTDQSTIELEGADYDTQNRSTYLQYMGLSTTGTYAGFPKSNMARLIMNGNNNIIGTQFTKPLIFLINDSEKARFDSLGNFQVNEQIKSKKYNITGSGYVANGSEIAFGAGNSSDFVTYNPSGRILFSTNGSVRMAMTNGGNIGIGTLAPTSKFEVSGTGAMRYVDGNQADGKYFRSNATGIASWGKIQTSEIQSLDSLLSTKENDLTFGTGFTRTGNNVYSDLATGKAGGGLIYGDTQNSGLLTISSTIAGTKGKIFFGNSGYDEANNRLGIGTQSPATKLHITSSDPNMLRLERSGLGSANILISSLMSNSASDILFDANNNSGGFIFRSKDAAGTSISALGIDRNGNVGIGETAPLTKFHVAGTGYFTGALGIGTSTLTGYGLRIQKPITGATTAYSISNETSIQSDVTSVAVNYNSTLGTASGTNLSNITHFLATQGTMSGTATSQHGFYVSSNMTSGSNVYAFRSAVPASSGRYGLFFDGTADNYIAGSLGIGTTSLNGHTLRISKNVTGDVNSYVVRANGQIQTDVTSSARYFNTLANAANNTTIGSVSHYIAEQASFGTGSTVTEQNAFYAPSSLVGANTNYAFRGNLPADGVKNYNLYMGGTAPNYLLGNLGIGTATPAATLEVLGNMVVRDQKVANTNSTNRFYSGAYSGNFFTNIVATGTATANTLVLGGGTGGGEAATRINFSTTTGVGATGTGATRMSIDESGNVGIGTGGSTIVSKLEVVDANGVTFRHSNTANTSGGSRVFLGAYSGNKMTAMFANTASGYNQLTIGGGTALGEASTQITFNTRNGVGSLDSGTERMRIDALGNIGVGTISPQKKFVVSNSGAEGFEFDMTLYTGAVRTLAYNRTTSAFIPLRSEASQHEFYTNNTERMKIDAAGVTTINSLKVVDGTQGAGKVLTSSADGSITAQTPVLLTKLTRETAFDIPPLLANEATSFTQTVTGAAIGDFVQVTNGEDLGNYMFYAFVSAANTVKIIVKNETGSYSDPSTTTFYIRILK